MSFSAVISEPDQFYSKMWSISSFFLEQIYFQNDVDCSAYHMQPFNHINCVNLKKNHSNMMIKYILIVLCRLFELCF